MCFALDIISINKEKLVWLRETAALHAEKIWSFRNVFLSLAVISRESSMV